MLVVREENLLDRAEPPLIDMTPATIAPYGIRTANQRYPCNRFMGKSLTTGRSAPAVESSVKDRKGHRLRDRAATGHHRCRLVKGGRRHFRDGCKIAAMETLLKKAVYGWHGPL